jgi:hypothetical protein
VIGDDIDRQIDELRVLFKSDEEARKAEQKAKYEMALDAHLEKRRQSLLDRKWQPHDCRDCWRAVMLKNPDLCCSVGKGTLFNGDVGERWWEF